jgi:hypothetical protein
MSKLAGERVVEAMDEILLKISHRVGAPCTATQTNTNSCCTKESPVHQSAEVLLNRVK